MFEREGTFECLELPGGKDALLGVIPLEALGLEIELKKSNLEGVTHQSNRNLFNDFVAEEGGRRKQLRTS
jgi:hypothetical protein